MKFFKPTITRRFAPPTIRLADLYSYSTDVNEPSESIKKSARKILEGVGYNKEEIGRIIYSNKDLPVMEMKKIVNHLHKGGISGFKTSANTLVDRYLHQEAVKKFNLNRHILDLAAEARREPLNKADLKINKINQSQTTKKKPARYPF